MDVVEDAACLNCGQPLTGNFCAGCGQKRPRVDLTLSEFLHETTHELTNWDGKIPSTLKALFLKPGLLTVDFFEGRRARWLSPLRLYLICSVAYFLTGSATEAITHREGRERARVFVTNVDGSKSFAPEFREEVAAGLPGRIFGVDRLERAITDPERLNREIEVVLPRAIFVLLPLLALFTRVAWRRRVPRYPAHLYMALHIHAAWFGALAVLTVITGFVTSPAIGGFFGLLISLYCVCYGLIAARRVFQDSWPLTILKSTVVGAVYSCCLISLSLLLLAYALFRM